MKLPNLDNAVVRAEKISDYLLSSTHPAGRHKARFFERLGFQPSAPQVLTQAFLEHARSNEVTTIEQSRYGTRYTIDGMLISPDGRNPRIQVIWFVESGGNIPYLVTAYPLPEAKT